MSYLYGGHGFGGSGRNRLFRKSFDNSSSDSDEENRMRGVRSTSAERDIEKPKAALPSRYLPLLSRQTFRILCTPSATRLSLPLAALTTSYVVLKLKIVSSSNYQQ
jgi:hypothetical protein